MAIRLTSAAACSDSLTPQATPPPPAPSFDLDQNLAVFRRLIALRPKALLFSHYGPHERPEEALRRQLVQYPAWNDLVHRSLEGLGDDGVVQEPFRLSCAGAKRYPHEFLRRRIRNSGPGPAPDPPRLP